MADEASASPDVLGANAQGQLRSIIERIERLNAEKAEIAEQIKEVKAEAKGNGFDIPVINAIVARRKKDPAKLQEFEAIFDLYLSAIDQLPIPFEPANADRDVKVTISTPGGATVSTNLAAMKGLAADLDLYDQAVALVRETGKPSTSYVQRRLQIGFEKAAGLIERMEREGVVGPANHAGKREVLAHA